MFGEKRFVSKTPALALGLLGLRAGGVRPRAASGAHA